MKNTLGNNVKVTLFGESHGESIGCVIDGLSSGIRVDEEFIKSQLALRRPVGKISTSRVEEDNFKIVSGVFNNYTTGTPICIVIENNNTKSKDYDLTRFLARPGHADYTANLKYGGYEDYRGGGHFSGRITAALVAAGAIMIKALNDKGIYLGSHIKNIGEVKDRDFISLKEDIDLINNKTFAYLDEKQGGTAIKYIEDIAKEGDSIGGTLESVIIGLPKGLGEPFFDSVESLLGHALLSIPGCKGVEFGLGFEMAKLKGSEVNDPFKVIDGEIKTTTNNNAGINGGITNGMPVILRSVIKPTPSIFKEQSTVNFKTNEDASLSLTGRHDPCIVHRARVVQDSLIAIVLMDLLETTFGENYFRG